MLPSQVAMISSIAISVRLEAIPNPLHHHPLGYFPVRFGRNSGFGGIILWRGVISVPNTFEDRIAHGSGKSQRSLPGGVEVNEVPDMLWHREAFDVAARLDFGSDIF